MTLGDVVASLAPAIDSSLAARPVTGLAYDSRRVQAGDVFFAFPGARVDGRAYTRAALDAGAVAVVSELAAPEGFDGDWIQVEHGRAAMSLACRALYGPPEAHLELIGITGTNGKTTTSYLVDSVLCAWGRTTGLLGTIEYHLAGEVLPSVNTTPESVDLYHLFGDLVERGGTHLTMEVSSHALALRRVYGIGFRAAVFTNLTRDHLDFHKTMEEYFAAKHLLFEGAGARPPAAAVVNWDDPWGRLIRPSAGATLLRYAIDAEDAEVRAREVVSGFSGLRFEIASPAGAIPIVSPLIGRINVYNILAAAGACLGVGVPPEIIAQGVAQCRAIPGRFERVDMGQPFLVVVDYAHTDDALRNTIMAARALEPKRILTLFGCGGDRDRAKRPLMAKAAAELSDFVVLTSDNPRSEDPLGILNDAMVGLRRTDTPHVAEVDRETAIRKVIERAEPGDIVILAGKGHETYQVLKDRTIHFDDREVARRVLAGFGYGGGGGKAGR